MVLFEEFGSRVDFKREALLILNICEAHKFGHNNAKLQQNSEAKG